MTAASGMAGEGPVVVVGGGVIGLCTAYYLAASGVPVEVVERRGLGSEASRGNAGWVCLSHSTPVPAPGVVRYALRSLGRPDSPLYLRPLPDPAFVRWLWRFWRSSTPAVFRRGYAAIADLNRVTFDLFDGLSEAGVTTTLTRPGMVHAFLSPAQARHHLAIQREMAEGHYPMPDDVTTGDEARLLDDALSPRVRASYLVEGEGVVDLEAFARGLGDALAASGVKVHEQVEVTGFRSAGGQVTALRTDRGRLPARPSSSRPACVRPVCCALWANGRRCRRARATASRWTSTRRPGTRCTSASAGLSPLRSVVPRGSAAPWS
jgi:glycine/D-amino acid oxidase-like deaminating enzyme